MIAYTKGPWSLETQGREHVVTAPDSEDEGSPWQVALVYRDCGYPDDQSDANANLISAAPTMADFIQRKADEGDAEAAQIMEAIRGS